MKFRFLCSLILCCAPVLNASGQIAATGQAVKPLQLGTIKNLCSVGELYCSGQFEKNDIERLREKGISRVISLRAKSEIDWDEAKELEKSGIEFTQIPIASPEDLNDAVLGKIRELLKNEDKKTLLHCGVGGRVAAAWLAYRVLDQGISLEQGLVEAEKMGLPVNSPMRDKVVNYIKQSKPISPQSDQEKSVKPGINDNFLADDLDVDEYINKFEIESREIFLARERILSACQIKKGMAVADIGAGTGLFTRLFSISVGDQGWVYAVEIAPRFLEHINRTATEAGLTNISGILGTERSVQLPKESVDVVFVCDTYHHFEYPSKTLASIMKGMKPGGKLIVVDFERIPRVSREWTLNHVRAGKDVVKQEIEAAGFQFIEELKIVGLEENYFLSFRKPK